MTRLIWTKDLPYIEEEAKRRWIEMGGEHRNNTLAVVGVYPDGNLCLAIVARGVTHCYGRAYKADGDARSLVAGIQWEEAYLWKKKHSEPFGLPTDGIGGIDLIDALPEISSMQDELEALSSATSRAG